MALRLSKEDEKTIAKLRKEIEKSWELIEQSVIHDKNQCKKIKSLEQQLEASDTLRLQERQKYKRHRLTAAESIELQKNYENLETKYKSLLGDYKLSQKYHEETKDERNALEKYIDDMETDYNMTKSELTNTKLKEERQLRKQERLKETLDLTQKRVLFLEEENNQRIEQLLEMKQENSDREQIIAEQLRKIEEKERIENKQSQELVRAEKQFKKQFSINAQISAEQRKLQLEYNALKQERNQINQELHKERKNKQTLVITLDKLNEARANDTKFHKKTVISLNATLKSLDEEKRLHTLDVTQIQSLRRKLLVSKELEAKEKKKVLAERSNVKLAEAKISGLKDKVNFVRQHTKNLRSENLSLQKNNIRHIQSHDKLVQRIKELEDEIVVVRLDATESRKIMHDYKEKLHKQRQRYEQTRADRAVKDSDLRAARDKIQEHQQKFVLLKQNENHLQSEIDTAESRIITITKEKEKVNKDYRDARKKVREKTMNIGELKQTIHSKEAEIDKLRSMMREGDIARKYEHMRYMDLVRDRDLLGSALVKRNDLLELVEKKVNLQNSIIKKGTFQYREKLRDIRLLKIQIANQERQLTIQKRKNALLPSLKKKIIDLQTNEKELKKQIKALSEMLHQPINVHQWRFIEARHESQFNLQHQVSSLQKRILKQKEKETAFKQKIVEQQQLIAKLKDHVKRGGMDASTQRLMSTYEDRLQRQSKDIKAMAGEINMLTMKMKASTYDHHMTTKRLYDGKVKLQRMLKSATLSDSATSFQNR
mmetsp:Transcript_5391/g.7942  ORF Transcript_5391/g.7942 Transcript_5391/m.7942 type:complete len:771 (+) Transcript_5391:359-2671(+)